MSVKGFERAMAALDTSSAARYGAEFEMLSDWALTHSPSFAPHVAKIEPWPVFAARTGLDRTDLGVDRVITTTAGEVWAVQNKGYAAATTVDHGALSRFALAAATGIPGGAARLILVTSGPGLGRNAAKVAKGMPNLTVVNRDWLARLDWPEDPTTILRHAAHMERVNTMPLQLRNQQKKAVQAIHAARYQGEREVQLNSACGTGKTLIMHRVAADTPDLDLVLYVVPSLMLLRQALEEFTSYSGGAIDALAVCSDATVAKRDDDTIRLATAELGAAVTTDPAAVAEWMNREGPTDRMRVVFSTYQSIDVVVDAQNLLGAPEFTVAFADEAHRLVSLGTGDFGEPFKRKDDAVPRIRAGFRVYATATPRRFHTAQLEEQAALGHIVDAMTPDSPVYGPQVVNYTFAEAIHDGVLVDYEVNILAVPYTAADTVQKNPLVVHESTGALVPLDEYLAAAALSQAHLLGARTVISYHNTVARAQRFTRLIDADPATPFTAAHVNGTQSTKRRTVELDRLRTITPDDPTGHLVTNVACLSEGIDVPALDAIVIVDPRESAVDIAQAIGRVLRRADGKTTGRIVLPIGIPVDTYTAHLTHQQWGDHIRQHDSRWRSIHAVITALADTDTAVEEIITDVLRNGTPHTGAPRPREVRPDTLDVFGDAEHATRPRPAGKVTITAPGLSPDDLAELAEGLRLVTARKPRFAGPNFEPIEVFIGHGIERGIYNSWAHGYTDLVETDTAA